MLKQWRIDLENDKSNKTITCLVRAFHAALARVMSEEGGQDEPNFYRVQGNHCKHCPLHFYNLYFITNI